jgi:hypothetical protein
MSIYCSYLTFDGNERNAPRPLVYRGSHLLPHNKDKRQGEFGISAIPSHITRSGKDNGAEGRWHPWLRVHVSETNQEMGSTVVITKKQAEKLRNDLSEWLKSVK